LASGTSANGQSGSRITAYLGSRVTVHQQKKELPASNKQKNTDFLSETSGSAVSLGPAEVRSPRGLGSAVPKAVLLLNPEVGTISRKTSGSTEKFNGQNPLDIAVTNALGLLRGQNFEN
jgi:hypothetical protein